MTNPETLTQPGPRKFPIDLDTYRQFSELYRWQERYSTTPIDGDLDGETGARFSLRFWDGQDHPTYSLKIAGPERLEPAFSFFMYQIGNTVFISSLSQDTRSSNALTDDEIDAVNKVIPLAIAEGEKIRSKPRRRLLGFLALRG